MTPSRFLLVGHHQRQTAAAFNTIARVCAFSSRFSTIVSSSSKLDINREQAQSMATTSSSRRSLLSLDSINPNVIKMEYAVRGPLVIRAGEIEKEIAQVSIL